MKSYTSRWWAKNCIEDTGLASAIAQFFGAKKRIGKNVKFIVNEDSFTGIDIHSEKDLYLAKWL